MIDANDVKPMPEPDPDAGFWSQTDILDPHPPLRPLPQRRTLRHTGLRAAPRHSSVEPHVVLPPIIGGTVSVNLFTISAGRSGQGKDAANSAGFAAVDFPERTIGDDP